MRGVVREIASGSGGHIVHFARNCPALVFQPSDPEPGALLSVAALVKATRVTNVRVPIALDASHSVWSIASGDDHLHQRGPHLPLGGDVRALSCLDVRPLIKGYFSALRGSWVRSWP